MSDINIIEVNSSNMYERGICCSKDKISPGYNAKVEWSGMKCNKDLKLYLAKDYKNAILGFIEFTDTENAWRPVNAKNYLFIHCLVMMDTKSRNMGIGSELIKVCEEEAMRRNKSGVCVMTSSGTWMADKRIFEKNGYKQEDKLGRFELYVKKFNDEYPIPELINWDLQLKKYKGWNLIYANQCPWHKKSVEDLKETAKEFKIDLNVIELKEPKEARSSPSGFGVFGIIKDGKLIEDHYISKTRFINILKKLNH